MALAFAEAGADVAISDVVADDGLLDATAKEVKGIGQKVITTQTDVTDRSQVQTMAKKVLDEFGRIDILINNAGIAGGRPAPHIGSSKRSAMIGLRGSTIMHRLDRARPHPILMTCKLGHCRSWLSPEGGPSGRL